MEEPSKHFFGWGTLSRPFIDFNEIDSFSHCQTEETKLIIFMLRQKPKNTLKFMKLFSLFSKRFMENGK